MRLCFRSLPGVKKCCKFNNRHPNRERVEDRAAVWIWKACEMLGSGLSCSRGMLLMSCKYVFGIPWIALSLLVDTILSLHFFVDSFFPPSHLLLYQLAISCVSQDYFYTCHRTCLHLYSSGTDNMCRWKQQWKQQQLIAEEKKKTWELEFPLFKMCCNLWSLSFCDVFSPIFFFYSGCPPGNMWADVAY